MSQDRDSDSAAVAHEFLARLLEDREDGRDLPLVHYQEIFPGHEEQLAREYATFSELAEEELGGDAHAANRSASHRLGRFRILRELGRGGQGVVYLAEDPDLHRQVAHREIKCELNGAACAQSAGQGHGRSSVGDLKPGWTPSTGYLVSVRGP